jgi:ABC-type glycerol-3-phosphate transport system substrate-binding protein
MTSRITLHKFFRDHLMTHLDGWLDTVQIASVKLGLLADLTREIGHLKSTLPTAAIKGATSPVTKKPYILPTTYYPWALHYRKSMVKDIGMNPEKIDILG